jgi:transcriptional regulator with XRE-family HTH domain
MPDEIRPPRAKLTLKQVREIRRILEYEPISYAALARRYGVSAPTISQIANYQTWRDIDRPQANAPPPHQSVTDADPDTIKATIRALGQSSADEP